MTFLLWLLGNIGVSLLPPSQYSCWHMIQLHLLLLTWVLAPHFHQPPSSKSPFNILFILYNCPSIQLFTMTGEALTHVVSAPLLRPLCLCLMKLEPELSLRDMAAAQPVLRNISVLSQTLSTSVLAPLEHLLHTWYEPCSSLRCFLVAPVSLWGSSAHHTLSLQLSTCRRCFVKVC